VAKGDRPAARLGRGEFEDPARANVVARHGFLQTIYRLAPEAVNALEQDGDAERWAARFGLEHVRWFIDVGSATLQMWERDPAMRRHRIWASLGIGGRLLHELPPLPAWQYEDESEADFDARVNQHKRQVLAIAAERGLIRRRELRNPLYVEWLVRRVIQGWPIEQIATTYQTEDKSPDHSTIQRGINEAAELVGLPRPATLKPQPQ
jgi:hypothetical protein